MWDSEEDPGLGNDAAAPIDDQNGISFAQDDDAEFTNVSVPRIDRRRDSF